MHELAVRDFRPEQRAGERGVAGDQRIGERIGEVAGSVAGAVVQRVFGQYSRSAR